MPIWYNKAKSKNPVKSGVCGFGFILFHSFSKQNGAGFSALNIQRKINAKFLPRK
jgi:hypothetical protein